jgi:exopolysaccharide biosynthesis polyprenyl glycosylphosphotransferase
MAERLHRYAAHIYELRGFLAPERQEPEQEETAVLGPLFGRLRDLRRVVDEQRVRLVILASRNVSRAEAMQLTTDCSHLGLEVLQVPFTWGLASARVESASVGELELVRLGGLSYPSVAEHIKRGFDLISVALGGLLISPVLLALAVAVKLEDRGPVFYVSPRAGRGGLRFPFLKFRSMVVGADKIRSELDNEADGRLFKVRHDPRVTRVGAVMRRWSLDELPQLWNVARGDMNLVGPRPLPIGDLQGIDSDTEYRYWFEQRSRVSPGITGLWQISGRSDLSFQKMVELDVYYIQHWSLLLDLQILIRTLPAVLRGRGAR